MQPCEQKDSINVIRADVTDVKLGFRDMVSEFRDLSKDLRASLLDGRETKVEVANLKRDVDIAFKEIRELDDREDDHHIDNMKNVQSLKEFKARIDDRFATLKVIPVICTIIVAVLTILNYMKSVK